MRKIYKSDIDVGELPPANASQMHALLLKLTEFRAVSDTDPFTFAPKILNFKQKEREYLFKWLVSINVGNIP